MTAEVSTIVLGLLVAVSGISFASSVWVLTIVKASAGH